MLSQTLKICIVPMGDQSSPLIKSISFSISEAYNLILEEVQICSKIKNPEKSYSSFRDQFDAQVILHHISKKFDPIQDEKILALTSKDLYSNGLNFVFGLAQKPGTIAVMSICRLDPTFWGLEKNKKLLYERAGKEAIHELGHTFGLGHCEDKACVMAFSNRISETDRKRSTFCEACSDRIFNINR